ncbi:MAG TPA: tetratricopeptide repeat protein [Terriglobales bacterium]|jgi:tetratricopeptide (TPR) repeat protein|nr:tetratricopeptide repeat protein [Terriglobales bacterium]
MKLQFLRFVAPPFLLFLFTIPCHGQGGPAMSRHDSEPAIRQHSLALMGKVEVEGGGDVARNTLVVLECGSKVRASSNVDSHGDFSLVLNETGVADQPGWGNSQMGSQSLADCSVSAQASGYRSSAALLAGGNESGIVQVGTLVLQRLAASQHPAEEFTVSAASLAAPEKAKQQFQKGTEQEKKGKWASASDYFRKAIQVYPRYAVAWLELGRTQVQQNNFAEAQHSFQQAATHDSKLLPAYFELARLQAEQKEWKALAETAGKMVEIAPDSSPMFWFLDAVANYQLHDFARAEGSAMRGLRLDTKHSVPQLEYLYGLVLGTHGDYVAAAPHIRNYLKLAPHATDSGNAQQVLSEFERLAPKAPTTAERQ